MHNTFEVWGWHELGATGKFGYEVLYAGESRENALGALWEAPGNGYKCVKLEWRP